MRYAIWILTLVCGGVLGCEWKGGLGAWGTAVESRDVKVWRPEPVRMRVYPSSRFIERDGQTMLEARVELRDEMDDPLKGVGRFQFELVAGGTPGRPAATAGSAAHPGGPGRAAKLYGWDVSVMTLAEQKEHYDSVTRAYLFRLVMDEPSVPVATTTLRVNFVPLNGERIDAVAVLEPGAW